MLNNITAKELGQELGLEVVGNVDCRLSNASSLEEAGEGSLSFMRSSKYSKWLEDSMASAIIVPNDLELPNNEKAFLIAKNPYVSFAEVLDRYYKPKQKSKGISEQAQIHSSAQIGDQASIEPFVLVDEDAQIGERCSIMSGCRIGRGVVLGKDVVLHANVVIEENSVIGDRVVIHPGAVIGSEGFGYTQTEQGNVKLPQIGYVEIGDDVEIGANTTIDRASMGKTVIGKGTKIDNLVQIGHGVQLGEHNVLCAQVGVAGSVKTGRGVILASKAGVGDHLTLGDQVIVGPMAGVTKDIAENSTVSGFPAMNHQDWLRLIGMFQQLPAWREKLKTLTNGNEPES